MTHSSYDWLADVSLTSSCSNILFVQIIPTFSPLFLTMRFTHLVVLAAVCETASAFFTPSALSFKNGRSIRNELHMADGYLDVGDFEAAAQRLNPAPTQAAKPAAVSAGGLNLSPAAQRRLEQISNDVANAEVERVRLQEAIANSSSLEVQAKKQLAREIEKFQVDRERLQKEISTAENAVEATRAQLQIADASLASGGGGILSVANAVPLVLAPLSALVAGRSALQRRQKVQREIARLEAELAALDVEKSSINFVSRNSRSDCCISSEI
jgi:hypothetical protein